MFAINTVWLHNFKSFRGKHEITLPTQPGLYFLTGKNEDKPSLETNGVGKSTILDAIYWCLYGSTLRGLKGPDIITWEEKTASVKVDMQVGDRKFQVKRTQAPNNLLLIENGQETIIDQQALQTIIRLTPTSFLYSVILPQFNEAFFDLGPTQKLTLFSQIMELDFWLLKSKEADKKGEEIENQLNSLNSEISANIGRSNLLKEDIDRLKLDEAKYDKNISNENAMVAERKAQMLYNKQRLEKQLLELDGQAEDVHDEVKQIEAEETANRTKIKAANNIKETASSAVAVLKNRLSALKASKMAMGELGTECTTCHQPITKLHVQAQQTALARQQKALEAELTTAEAELAEKLANVEELESIEADRRQRLRQAQKAYDSAYEAANEVQGALNGVLRDLTNIEPKLRTKVINPYRLQINHKLSQLKETEAQITADRDTARGLQKALDETNFWVGGFKRIRLFIIEDTLKTLEIEINNCLVNLGLQDWLIELDVERENKTGGVTKGFTVLVYPPNVKRPIRWEAFSGGEAQRLKLAGNLGLANLIMHRAGLVNTIEFYDEPSQHLSPKGLYDLVETLNDRALDGGKTIFLIDHHTIEYGHFVQTFTVVMDKDGSMLV